MSLLDQSFFSEYKGSITIWSLFLLALCLLKVVATTITLSSGGNGGNFAPGMFVGAFLGCWFASLVNATGFTNLPVSNFTMVGMAGLISGIMYAPLTGIFLIAEVTGGYDLIIPLMIVAEMSFFLARHF